MRSMDEKDYEVLIPPAHRYPSREGDVRSRFAEFVLLCCRQALETGDLLDSYEDCFSLENAVGKQLDFVAQLVGADRQLPFAIVGSDGLLGDDDLRLLILSRIVTNIWDGTNESLVKILNNVFSNYGISFVDRALVPDSVTGELDAYKNMAMKYQVRGTLTDLQKQLFQGDLIVPRPAGVEVAVDFIGTTVSTEIYADTKLAAESMESAILQGIDREE